MPDAQERKQIQGLLDQGLDLFGLNKIDQAVACWRRVLQLDPAEARAADYLRSAGVGDQKDSRPLAGLVNLSRPMQTGKEPRLEGGTAPNRSIEDEVSRLMSAGHLEKAWEKLKALHKLFPNHSRLQNVTTMVKKALTNRYLEGLGPLDVVPVVDWEICERAQDSLGVGEKYLLSCMDGVSPMNEIIGVSKLETFETCRTLLYLLDTEVIHFSKRDAPGRTEGSVPEEPTSRQREAADEDGGDTLPAVSYEALFETAMRAYMRRDYSSAISLFERCLKIKPDDPRLKHNLSRLKRKRES